MKIKTEELLTNLTKRTLENIKGINNFQLQDEEILNFKRDVRSWSVLECIEHLNLYGEFYLSEIEYCIEKSKTAPEDCFKSGILGNYFAKSMLPSDNMKKIKTFSGKDPNGKNLDKNTLAIFLEQQEIILALLERSQEISLNKTKAAISISRFIKLRLGDVLRVVIYHNQRHIQQAKRVLEFRLTKTNSIE